MRRRRDILLLDLGGRKLDDVVVSTIMLERECTKEDMVAEESKVR